MNNEAKDSLIAMLQKKLEKQRARIQELEHQRETLRAEKSRLHMDLMKERGTK